MTAFEYLELAHNGWSTAMATVSLAIAVLSGYIVIAYMVGGKLSKVQVTVLNIGYLSWGGFLIFTTFTLVLTANEHAKMAAAIQSEASQGLANPYAPHFVLGIGAYLLLASVWFMWNVRQDRSEAP